MVALIGTRVALPGLGPDPQRFFEGRADMEARDSLVQLLADLMKAQDVEVPSVLARQRRALWLVAGMFAATFVYSTLVLV